MHPAAAPPQMIYICPEVELMNAPCCRPTPTLLPMPLDAAPAGPFGRGRMTAVLPAASKSPPLPPLPGFHRSRSSIVSSKPRPDGGGGKGIKGVEVGMGSRRAGRRPL